MAGVTCPVIIASGKTEIYTSKWINLYKLVLTSYGMRQKKSLWGK
jgi:hypothetical protein